MKNIIVRENIISKRRYIDYGKDNIIKNSYSNIVLNQPYYNSVVFVNLNIDDYKNNLLLEGSFKVTYQLNNPVEASFQNNIDKVLKSIINSYLSFYFNNVFKYQENINEYDLYFHKFNMIADLNRILNLYFKYITIKDISNIKLIEYNNELNTYLNAGIFKVKRKNLKDEIFNEEYQARINDTFANNINKNKSTILYIPNNVEVSCKDDPENEYVISGSILYKIIDEELYRKSNKEELDKFLSYTFTNLMKNIYINKNSLNNLIYIDPFIYENIIKHNNEEYNLTMDKYGIRISLILVENVYRNISKKPYSKTLKK